MTTSIRAALNTHPSSQPTANPAAKQSTPAHAVEATTRRDQGQRPQHDKHRTDPAWQAALQAAVEPRGNVRPSPKNAAAGGTQTVAAAGKSSGPNARDPGRSLANQKATAHDLTTAQSSTKTKVPVTPTHSKNLEATESATPPNHKLPTGPGTAPSSVMTGKNPTRQNARSALSAKRSTDVGNVQRTTERARSESAKAAAPDIKDTRQPVTIEAKPIVPAVGTAKDTAPASQPSVPSEAVAMLKTGSPQSRHEGTSVDPHAGSSLMAANPSTTVSSGILPDMSHAAPVSSSPTAVAGSSNTLSTTSLQHLGAQIHTLHHAGGGQAEIRLDPPTLGTVNIQLTLQQNQVQVNFQAAQTATAQMLQASLPQLVHTLQQQGITLAHAQVHAASEGGGLSTGSGGPGQQPGQQSGQQAQSENARAIATPERASITPNSANGTSQDGVRAYA